MIFEFDAAGKSGMMGAFASVIGTSVENGTIILPETLGKGYIKGYNADPMIKMMIHQYVLKEDLVFKRIAAKGETDVITVTFHNVINQNSTVQNLKFLPSVQVTSADIDFETLFPANTQINTIIIAVHIDLLKSSVRPENNALFENIISGKQPYLYEEIISPQIQDTAGKIMEAHVPEELRDFYFKFRSEELIYLFFAELLKRQQAVSYPVNLADVKKIYAVRDKILSDLSIPPNLPALALFSGMSESKMKRLFKQIFGNSIYSYYQAFRMDEAVYLIKEQKLSVSETGYKLGFSNLSHFTRIFEAHTGIKPKRYALLHAQ